MIIYLITSHQKNKIVNFPWEMMKYFPTATNIIFCAPLFLITPHKHLFQHQQPR